MGPYSWMTCLWPGLPRLWWRGQAAGLFTAAAFALWLNCSLAATFIAPDRFSTFARMANWAGLLVFWGVCVRRGAGRLSHFYCGDGQHNEELFQRAQEEYLKGHWFEAESLLLRLVRDDPADVEGRLLLATLYRHTQRPALAKTQLDLVSKYPHAARWAWEIHCERKFLERVATSPEIDNKAVEPAPDVGHNRTSPHEPDSNGVEPEPSAESPAEIGSLEKNGGLSKAA